MKMLFLLVAGAMLGGCVPAQRADDTGYCVYYYSTVPIRLASTAVVVATAVPMFVLSSKLLANTYTAREQNNANIFNLTGDGILYCWGREPDLSETKHFNKSPQELAIGEAEWQATAVEREIARQNRLKEIQDGYYQRQQQLQQQSQYMSNYLQQEQQRAQLEGINNQLRRQNNFY